MGIYHNISNETTREFIDPGKVGGGSIKEGFVINCGPLLAWLMNGDWYGNSVRVNKDISDHYFTVKAEYKDVTVEAIEGFNRVWPDDAIEVNNE